MTYPSDEELDSVCAYLGLADDADSHATYATEAHRCFKMPNPTKIATGHQESFCLGANHPTCPVFIGESVQRAAPPRAVPPLQGDAPVRRAPAPRPAERPAASSPFGGRRAPREEGDEPAEPRRSPRPMREAPLRPTAGTRSSGPGFNMPIATVALFGLALVALVLAIVVTQFMGGDDSSQATGGEAFQTAQAQQTRTSAAQPTQQPQGTQTVTVGGGGTPGNQTPAGTQAARTGTPGVSGTGTPNATTTGTAGGNGGKTYTVKSGDICGTIADQFNTTTPEILRLNPTINADCSNLQLGQVIKLP